MARSKTARAVRLDESKFEELQELSKRTRVPMATYIRDGIDLLLAKYGVTPKPPRQPKPEEL